MVENKKSLCLTPGSKRSSVDQYREAWKLMMRSAGDDIALEPPTSLTPANPLVPPPSTPAAT
jgi:hypothetical protein